jgi:hypothetical protein
MRSDQIDQLVLLRGFKERGRLVFLGSAVAAFMIFMLSEMAKWRPSGFMEQTVHILAVEIFMTFGLFGCLALVWGLFAPRWVEGFLVKGFRRVLRVIWVIGVASLCSVLFYLWR